MTRRLKRRFNAHNYVGEVSHTFVFNPPPLGPQGALGPTLFSLSIPNSRLNSSIGDPIPAGHFPKNKAPQEAVGQSPLQVIPKVRDQVFYLSPPSAVCSLCRIHRAVTVWCFLIRTAVAICDNRKMCHFALLLPVSLNMHDVTLG